MSLEPNNSKTKIKTTKNLKSEREDEVNDITHKKLQILWILNKNAP